MIPENLQLISAQPHDFYFMWQIEVQIVNFRKFGLSDRMHVLVWFPDNKLREQRGEPVEIFDMKGWIELSQRYPEVKFYFYKDKGVSVDQFLLYIPQLRPQILAKHFDLHPELTDKLIFYHDSDILFNFLPDFEKLGQGDANWISNTSHYLDYSYMRRIEEKGSIPQEEAIQVMCDIGKVPVEFFKSMDGDNGGAQYILKNIDGDFWRDVEETSLQIRKAFTHKNESNAAQHPSNIILLENSVNSRYFPNENDGFQSWCADMWAINFCIWNRQRDIFTTPDLDFSWATDGKETYLKKPIYHNAGATGAQPGIFYKGAWRDKSPIGKNHAVRKDSASWFYAQAIMEVPFLPETTPA